MLLKFLTIIGALSLFLYGKRMLSSGIQKALGERLRKIAGGMTGNTLKRIFTGLGWKQTTII